MTNILNLIGRIVVIGVGYLCATLVASLLLNALYLVNLFISYQPDQNLQGGIWEMLFYTAPVLALMISYFAFVPSFIIILIGEYYNKRGSLFYSLSGIVVVLWIRVAFLQQELFDASKTNTLMNMLAAGITGGFVYWAIAGRWTNIISHKAKPEIQ